MSWTDFLLRLKALVFRSRADRDLEEEFQFHLEMEARKKTQAGLTYEEAVRMARVDFGGVDQIKEECRSIRGTQLIETMLQDIRYAVRYFLQRPGFAVGVIATIALGLGLNTALFTIFNAYVLRPLAIRDPNSVYSFTWVNREGKNHSFSSREFEDFKTGSPAFSEAAAARFFYAWIDGHPMMGELVTGNYFQMLGVGASVGRTLLPEDSAIPEGEHVIVLSYAAWKNKFGGDPAILGKQLFLRGNSVTVVGVTNPSFTGLGDTPHDYWAPLSLAPRLDNNLDLFGPTHPEQLRIVGRIAQGLSENQVRAALLVWSKQITVDHPEREQAVGIVLRSEATALPLSAELLAAFSPVVAIFALVLLMACANVANMMKTIYSISLCAQRSRLDVSAV